MLSAHRPALGSRGAIVRPRRVLMVATSSNVHTQRWAGYFVGRGYDVTVVSQTAASIDGVRVVQFPPDRAWWTKLPRAKFGGGWQLWLAGWLRWLRIVTDLDPDIIHVHFVHGDARDYFYYRGHPNLVVSTYGTDVVFDADGPPSPVMVRRLRSLLTQATAVTATTEFLAAETRKFMPPGKPIHVIPFGVDCDHFTPRITADRPDPNVVTVGFAKQHLDRKYGADVLLDAFARINAQRPATRLIIAGADGLEALLRRRTAELRLNDCVEFAGRLPHDAMPALLQRLDIFVMPSICREGFGVAAVEASACGIPVVASAGGGVHEAVVDGETGLLVPPRDPDALASACIRLIDDPARRRCMGEAGRRLVSTRYNWSDTAARVEALYESLPRRRASVAHARLADKAGRSLPLRPAPTTMREMLE